MAIDLGDLKARQQRRLDVLAWVYEKMEVEEHGHVQRQDLGRAFDLPDVQMNKVLYYLLGQNLITLQNNGNEIRITHQGILEIEQVLQYPDQRTPHFMQQVVNHFHTATNVQVGSDNSLIVRHSTDPTDT